jgi:acylphosphatase
MIKRLELLYSGKMDQTDFRETAERFATAHQLVGFVKKLENDMIKIVAEGPEDELRKFMRDFDEDMDIYIEHFSANWADATGEFKRFELNHI